MAAAAAAGMAGLPAAAASTFPPVPPPPPGISTKCSDCGIPFYKRENLLIHKQHYCSGKKLRAATAPLSPPLTNDNPGNRVNNIIKQEPPTATVTAATSTTSPDSTPTPASQHSPPLRPHDHTHDNNSKEPSALSTSPRIPAPLLTTPPAKLPTPGPISPSVGGLEDVRYKFFCIPCNIKYSSASNLKAHKEYYCPHGKNSEHTIILQVS
jgi:hypothetical protein